MVKKDLDCDFSKGRSWLSFANAFPTAMAYYPVLYLSNWLVEQHDYERAGNHNEPAGFRLPEKQAMLQRRLCDVIEQHLHGRKYFLAYPNIEQLHTRMLALI